MKLKKKKALILAGGALAGAGFGTAAYVLAYKKGWIDDPSQEDADSKNYSCNCAYDDHDHFLTEGSLG